MIDTDIRNWDDATAIRVLDTYARARLRRAGGAETELTPELEAALRREFEVENAARKAEANAEGDLARAALMVLADDPQNREAMIALANGPESASFAIVETVAVIAAALIALQTHVKFERDKSGKFSLQIEKKPTKDTLLKPLVTKLVSLLPR